MIHRIILPRPLWALCAGLALAAGCGYGPPSRPAPTKVEAAPALVPEKPGGPVETGPAKVAEPITNASGLPPAQCRGRESVATSFDELALNYDGEEGWQAENLTPRAKGLLHKTVCLRGWISAASVSGGKSSRFILVRHNGQCCFGQGAPPSDNVQVSMDPGGLVAFTAEPIQVEGILTLAPYTGPDNRVWSVYHLQARYAGP